MCIYNWTISNSSYATVIIMYKGESERELSIIHVSIATKKIHYLVPSQQPDSVHTNDFGPCQTIAEAS